MLEVFRLNGQSAGDAGESVGRAAEVVVTFEDHALIGGYGSAVMGGIAAARDVAVGARLAPLFNGRVGTIAEAEQLAARAARNP